MIIQKNILTGIIALLILLPSIVEAKVGGLCVYCHTMHNSQAGMSMAFELDLTKPNATKSDTTPNNALLKTDCIGCHQGTNTGTTAPFILDTRAGGPDYGTTGTDGDTLAGGNFYWVSTGQDRTGHNVAGLASQDLKHTNIPPGGSALVGDQLTCAGINGCHGSELQSNQIIAIRGGHHNNDMSAWNDGLSITTSYRFLDGIQGKEDSDYEYKPDSSHHNKYYGINSPGGTGNSGTISNHCARCHNNFHDNSSQISAGTLGNNVWIRHPTDFDMSNAKSQGSFDGSEYDYYNDTQNINPRPYSVISPVATKDKTTTVNATVYTSVGADDAIVMCLSCHRAHGSPFDGILRWNYKNWPGTGVNGCAKCHTTKN